MAGEGTLRRCPRAAVAGAACLLLPAAAALAADPENCLLCHRYPGLGRASDGGRTFHIYSIDPDYYDQALGPHARLRCTDCHVRDEVYVVPHQVRTPVDCARACHMRDAAGQPLEFSHESVAVTLAASAHGNGSLRPPNPAEPLLRDGQSQCLYCHDEPVFRVPPEWSRLAACGGTQRCNTCHNEEFPVQVDYFTSHVLARLQPARPVRQLAQVCAVCHSDPAAVSRAGGHDAVASYFHSFHGKAALLGSTETANCVNCHASEAGNVHAMLPGEDPASSVNAGRLPTTCRTTDCHPGAAPGLSAASVHLQIEPRSFPLEFTVAALFILLTAGVMIVYFILIALELINDALGRRDPDHSRLLRLAQHLKRLPEGQRLLQRMTVHQRLQHWALAVAFILLVATGLPIKYADSAWAEAGVQWAGGLTVTRWVHRLSGLALIAVFVYHLCYLAALFVMRRRQAQRSDPPQTSLQIVLRSPMVVTLDDVRSFWGLLAYLVGLRQRRPRLGYMSFTQKFEYWAVFWGTPILGITGLALWGAPAVTDFVSGRLLNFAYIIHSDEAYLAFIYIAVVHMFAVIFSPVVFPLSPGTVTGQAPAEELAEAHAGQLEEAARLLGVSPDDEPSGGSRRSRLRAASRRVYSGAMAVVCLSLCTLSMSYLVGMLRGHQAPPVDIVKIPRTLGASELAVLLDQPQRFRVIATDRPRAPLAHYHQIPYRHPLDLKTDCTTSGCHPLLPHGERVEVRSFLNMHTSVVDCMVCHAAEGNASAAVRWIDPGGLPLDRPPAMLRLAGRLAQSIGREAGREVELNEELQALLAEVIEQSGESPSLRDWLVRLETTHPEGKLWNSIVEQMRLGVEGLGLGRYGARLALLREGRVLGRLDATQTAARDALLAGGAHLSAERRDALLRTIHGGVVKREPQCARCHTPAGGFVDLAGLGYPRARVESLQNNVLARQIQSIEAGQPFHLPVLLDSRPP
jgi:cytochrome b subunit of formate dehydrogenase